MNIETMSKDTQNSELIIGVSFVTVQEVINNFRDHSEKKSIIIVN